MEIIYKILSSVISRLAVFCSVLATALLIMCTDDRWSKAYPEHYPYILGFVAIVFILCMFGMFFHIIFEPFDGYVAVCHKKRRYKSLSTDECVILTQFINNNSRAILLDISKPAVALLLWDKILEKISDYPEDVNHPSIFAVALPEREWRRLKNKPNLMKIANTKDNSST